MRACLLSLPYLKWRVLAPELDPRHWDLWHPYRVFRDKGFARLITEIKMTELVLPRHCAEQMLHSSVYQFTRTWCDLFLGKLMILF